jgi:hypothetical protein
MDYVGTLILVSSIKEKDIVRSMDLNSNGSDTSIVKEEEWNSVEEEESLVPKLPPSSKMKLAKSKGKMVVVRSTILKPDDDEEIEVGLEDSMPRIEVSDGWYKSDLSR